MKAKPLRDETRLEKLALSLKILERQMKRKK